MSSFTLVEMLVAMVVLTLLIGLILQLSSSTMSATNHTHQKIEADEGARQVLDAVAGDYLGLITEYGSPCLINSYPDPATSADNTQFAFLTQSRGPSAGTRSLAVSYRLENGNLERLVLPVMWTPPETSVQSALEAMSGTTSGTTTNVIASGIVRFIAVASLSNGTTVPLTPLPTAPSWTQTSVDNQPVSPYLGLNITDSTQLRVRTITLAVAALDAQNYRILSTANLNTIGTALASPTLSGTSCETPVELWLANIAAGDLSSLPHPALAALQVIQKTYSLPQ